MKVLYAPLAWLADGWQPNVRIEIDGNGLIAAVTPRASSQPGDERVTGPLRRP